MIFSISPLKAAERKLLGSERSIPRAEASDFLDFISFLGETTDDALTTVNARSTEPALAIDNERSTEPARTVRFERSTDPALADGGLSALGEIILLSPIPFSSKTCDCEGGPSSLAGCITSEMKYAILWCGRAT